MTFPRLSALAMLLMAALATAMCGGTTPTSPSSTTAAAATTTTASTSASTSGTTASTGSSATAASTTPSTTTSTAADGGGVNLTALYSQFYNGVRVTMSGGMAVVTTQDLPDHNSPYWGTGHAKYEAAHAGMVVNPGRIAEQNLVFRIPTTPARATASDTPMGPMGVATNGVPLYNQYAAGRQPLTGEIISFDRYNGHPQQQNQYHYHFEPLWLTRNARAVLIGILLDGFPVYGPQDSGGATPGNLDSCNGHVGQTPEVPGGVYHYHATTAVPYLAGCYAGTPGSVTGG